MNEGQKGESILDRGLYFYFDLRLRNLQFIIIAHP